MMNENVTVQRWFPTHDFVIRTSLPEETVVRVVTDALLEPPQWIALRMLPSDRLFGHIAGTSFSCRPETGALGGRGAPSVVGEITGGEHGTDVRIRVSEWPLFVIPGLFVPLGVGLLLSAKTPDVWPPAMMMIGASLLAAATAFVVEVRRVRGIFVRLLLPNRSEYA